MCISTTSQPRSAQSAASSGSARSAVTSLTIVAPASSAAAATAAFEVSIETVAPGPPGPARASTTGPTRSSSSLASTASAPGRVDSPPTSRIVGALGGELAAVGDRGLGVEEQAPVRERVGGDVDDPHQACRVGHLDVNGERAAGPLPGIARTCSSD